MGTFNRRQFMLATGAVGAGLAGVTALAGCSTGQSPNEGVEASQSVTLPTYRAYAAVEPDLPGTEAGVQPGFYKYPSEHPTSVEEVPGRGGVFTSMSPIYGAAAPPVPGNKFWVELNKRLGVELQTQSTLAASYNDKLATVIAGDQLPRIVRFQANLPEMDKLMKAKFVNLSEYLSGDAVLNYPNLANVPTAAWKVGIFGDGFYGIPVPRPRAGNYRFVRKDLFDAAGLSIDPKSFDELMETAKALTDRSKNRFGFASGLSLKATTLISYEVGHDWTATGGKLVRNLETPQYKEAVAAMVEAWKAGVVHPEGFVPTSPFKDWFMSGVGAILHDGPLAWTGFDRGTKDIKGFEQAVMTVPKQDGSGAAPVPLGAASFGFQAISKAEKDSVEETLRVCNYLAAPFGTAEDYFITFGVEGVDHILENGTPTITKQGTEEMTVSVGYVADAPGQLYYAGVAQRDVDVQHEYQSKVIPTGLVNPIEGMYSPTAESSDGKTAGRTFDDAVDDIIQGRRPLSDFDALVADWRTKAGDAMRGEFEAQL